ncbi:transposase [Geotalea uraniireducens]|nr:transposase [Geotalea uraniireducens]
MTYNPDVHHRQSIRLRSYDYRLSGAYFITVCIFQREPILAEIVDGAARLTPLGEVVREEWLRSGQIRQEIELDEYVVMPNHLHGIVFIRDNVGAHGMRPGGMHPDCTPDYADSENRAHGRAPLHRSPKSLGALIAGFKSACTKRTNEMRATPGLPIWQRNYHERIIRNDEELHALRDYIYNNPARWENDSEHPARNMDAAGNAPH